MPEKTLHCYKKQDILPYSKRNYLAKKAEQC